MLCAILRVLTTNNSNLVLSSLASSFLSLNSPRNEGGEEEGEEELKEGGWGSTATLSSTANNVCDVEQAPYRMAPLVLPKRLTEGGRRARWPEQRKQAVEDGVVVAMAAAGGRR